MAESRQDASRWEGDPVSGLPSLGANCQPTPSPSLIYWVWEVVEFFLFPGCTQRSGLCTTLN